MKLCFYSMMTHTVTLQLYGPSKTKLHPPPQKKKKKKKKQS